MTASEETELLETRSPDYPARYAAGRRVLVTVHGLLTVLGVYVLLASFAETGSPYPLFVLPLLVVGHVALYSLSEGFPTASRFQPILILAAVTATAAWFLQFSIQAGLGYLSAVACLLLVPLVWRRLEVWFGVTAGLFGFAFVARVIGWAYPETGSVQTTEGVVLIAAVLLWIAFGFVFDFLKQGTGLAASLAREKRKVLTVEEVSRRLAAAEDVETAFSVTSMALRQLAGGRHCRLALVDPIRCSGTVAAVESESRDSPGDPIELGERSPLRRILNKDQIIHVGKNGGVIIRLETGFGLLHVITCDADRDLLDDDTVALLEGIAEATARTMHNVQEFGETKERAQTDALTGLPNRGSFQTMVKQEFLRAKRHSRPVSLLMVDLDYLKNINDRFGHPMGDMAIREVAERIQIAARGSDYLAARYGGEEFCVILPETDFEGAVQAAQRICDAIAETPLPTVGRITASVGVATYPLNAINKDDLIQAADGALYKAKRAGRNQVATPDPELTTDSTPVR
jgi:diguanylate cyclase (GGDEF)-like protein